MVRCYANGGNCLHLPDHTIESVLAAIASGAEGLHLHVCASAEGEPVLLRSPDLALSTNGAGMAHDLPLGELLRLDAADRFLADTDAPWRRNPSKHYLLPIPRLDEALWWLPPGYDVLLELVAEDVATAAAAGRLLDRVADAATSSPSACAVAASSLAVAGQFAAIAPAMPLYLGFQDPRQKFPGWNAIAQAKIRGVVIPFGWAFTATASGVLDPTPLLVECAAHPEVSLVIRCDASAPLAAATAVLDQAMPAAVLSTPCPSKLLAHLRAPRWVLGESFAGTTVNRALWKFGFARIDNDETRIWQDNGFHVDIREGDHYSGGSVLSVFPLVGDFSVQAAFTATNPHLAATMELAVINMSGNRHHTEVQRVDRLDEAFDVHASAPFVCTENDEDDGFRIMNNQGSTTWTNRYHRNVGTGGCREGVLRLDRSGAYFAGYYRDSIHSDWVGCGGAVNYSLNPMVFLRLGAKHWPKGQPPYPANHVTFRDVEVRLFGRDGRSSTDNSGARR